MSGDETRLAAFVHDAAKRLAVPGAAVGVLMDGVEHYAYSGVTSVDNPLPVDATTLFQFGSTGKTFTGTAIMRLVEEGRVDLDAPVRTYVPELRLADESVASRVTVLQLLNHTSGWHGDMEDDTGEGDDALARYVERMREVPQTLPLGAAVSYSNSGVNLAGRVIEKVTGRPYERAIEEMLLRPLGLDHTFFFMNDIMTRRFVVGHHVRPDGTTVVARPWGLPRGGNAAGGMSANARDQIAWARFHLGDGCAPDGTRLLSREGLERMRQATVHCPGGAVGDACGISWWLRDVGGVRQVSHGGTMVGQHSAFVMVPERGFAVASLTNADPGGPTFNDEVVRWALAEYVGVDAPELVGERRPDADLAAYAGRYVTPAAACEVRLRDGGLEVHVVYDREAVPEALREEIDAAADAPPTRLAMLAGGDRYVVPDGPGKGMRGFFRRDASGRVDALHLGGRLAPRAD